MREGRSLRSAVETGWAKARHTIIVADMVSLIAAVLLYFFAVGGVRGFAFTLGLTTIVDLIIVFFFTKPMVSLLAGWKFFSSGHPLSGLSPKSVGMKSTKPATSLEA
jgi:preprotein translocase subunit SecD